MATKKLRDIAKVIRSKNAKPFRLTFDVIFPNKALYSAVVQSNALTAESFASLYGVPVDLVTSVINFDAGNAIKITIKRPKIQGSMGESDVYGCQHHVPLLDCEVVLDCGLRI